ncbi:RecF/RecN/SMC [Xylaria intraflava]|nr:RecF/RecN/SMC [Xylaria intraflava]
MGKLVRLELYNFKSYKGHHTLLFGDSYFTSIIGPNGSGKSNSMDAISFVLGIKSSHLRSAHLKDLVYRGRVLKTYKINDDGSAVEAIENGQTNGHVNGDDHDKPNRGDPKTAWVMAVYEDDVGDEHRWRRTITNQGSSEYRINDPVVTALGRDFDSVIVDSEKVGVSCVEHLKEKRFAPMTFIPLDNIKVNAVNSAVKGISGARLTIDTIDFDPSLERAMSYACGSSIVCDDLQIAKHICFDRRIRVKAVTLDGTVIHKAGLMTGGHGPDHKGGKRRFEDADVQSLERALEKNQQELDALPRNDRRNTAEDTVRNELAELEQRLHYCKNELATFEQNLSSKKKELDHVKRQLKEWQPKFKEEDNKLQKTRSSVEMLKTAIAQVEDKVFSGFCKRLGYSDIRSYEAQQGSWEAEAAEKRNQFDLQKSRLESNKNWEVSRHNETNGRLHSLEDRLKRLSQDIKAYKKEKAEIEEAMSGDKDSLAALEEQLERLKDELATQNEKVHHAKADVQKRTKDIDNRLKAITALETELQKNSAGKFALLRRCRLEQIDIPLAAGSLDNLPNEDNLLHQDPDAMDVDDGDDAELMADALNDYGIEINYDKLDDDLKTADDEQIEDKLLEKISSLTAELDKLNPNMRAMERLEVVEARLKATENDFEESKAQYKAAKEAFDTVKAKRFELFDKAFTHIRAQISQVYKDLTRSDQYPLGGQAYLDIEEDTDKPYLSGIKYHAMPPLKRFRDMEHLSGGEKTMAALALLFAIHSYQPSPFFVLDEVDAALDNANVEKIKNYIRNHAGPGMQFIVISLKAGLFQDSESLVGVYRDQEVNSSKTLTLDVSFFSITFVPIVNSFRTFAANASLVTEICLDTRQLLCLKGAKFLFLTQDIVTQGIKK